MSKEKVSFENMLAGLLVRFGKASITDLKVVQDDLANKYGIFMSPFALDYHGISNYIMKVGDSYYPISDEAKKKLEAKQGKVMEEYLANLNVEEFVLLKIKELGAVSEYMMGTVFNDEQEKVVNKLVDDLDVIYVWNSDVPHDDYQEIQLTSMGEARVFELQYKEQVEEFRTLLVSSWYDVNLIPDFLRVQDFSKNVYDILNLDNFLYFCSKYDRCATAPTVSSVIYKRAKYVKDEGFTPEAKEMLNGMLSVWDDGHCIYVAHPNHVFKDKYLTSDNHDIKQVDWDKVDIEKMKEMDDYKIFIMPDSNDAFKYVHKRLGHQVMKKHQEGVDETSFLVVVERYHIDGEDQFLVRGLIRGDMEGYALGFNPEFERVIPKSIWEKSIRFSGNEVPTPYLVKRQTKKELK